MTDSFDFDEPVGESPESRLCKELLGQDYEEDPESVFDKMNADRKEIAQKYSIPLLFEQGQDYKKYAQELVDFASRENIPVLYVDSSRLESEGAAAGRTSSGDIAVPKIDFDKSTTSQIYNWSVRLGHELIHALQERKEPNMPIEKAEYEAYVATYLPTAYAIASKEVGGVKGYLMYFRAVDNVLDLIKGSSLYNYKKRGIPENNISWYKTIES